MLLTKQGKEFIENMESYNQYELTTLVNISGTEILKSNQILRVSTIYLESEDGEILFVADYCSPREEVELISKIKKNLNIKKEINFTIEDMNDEKSQEMIRYLTYSNPDIRPVLFSGEVEIDDNIVSIQNGKILLNNEETNPQVFITTLFAPETDAELKMKLINEVEKRKNELLAIINQLTVIQDTLGKDASYPKIVDADGECTPSIIFKNEKGKFQAITIGENEPKTESRFKIVEDASWDMIREAINKNNFINNKKDEFIEKLLEGGYNIND